MSFSLIGEYGMCSLLLLSLITSGMWQRIFAFTSLAPLVFYVGYSLVIEYRLRLKKERGTTTTAAATTTTTTVPGSSGIQGGAPSTVQQTVEEHPKQA
jgi:hypothetical protein